MEYQVIVDTDYILGISKNINNTSGEISNSISALEKVCNDLGTNTSDKNMQNFKNNFATYLNSLKEVVTFYSNMTSTINNLVKEIEDVDNNDAGDLKKSVINNEEGDE